MSFERLKLPVNPALNREETGLRNEENWICVRLKQLRRT